MPLRCYILPSGQSGDLVVSWRPGSRRRVIRRNGKCVDAIPDWRTLPHRRKSFRLSDGSILRLEVLYTGSIPFDFDLFLNEERLTYQESAARSLAISCGTVLFIAGINLLAGLLDLSGQLSSGPASLLFLWAGLSSLVFSGGLAMMAASALYLVLGWRIGQRSWKAVAIAVGVIGLDSAYLVLFFLRGGGESTVFVQPLLLSRLILLVLVATGLRGVKQRQVENSAPSLVLAKGVKPGLANLLALLLDPISWIFHKIDSSNR